MRNTDVLVSLSPVSVLLFWVSPLSAGGADSVGIRALLHPSLWADLRAKGAAGGRSDIITLGTDPFHHLLAAEQGGDIRSFPEEATVLDTRFKDKIGDNTTVWVRIKEKLVAANLSKQPPPCKKAIKSPLEELFVADDELKMKSTESRALSIENKVNSELKMYRVTNTDPVARWWTQTNTYPFLHIYVCRSLQPQ
ncbi:hypothetical protein IRJ41_010371 [Triplophysa rosa]|uniref:Uncharacterized protein n=1 Tax=Triplophysa rosa TaxID=992332 RepID=A0A9W7TM64_TRIRA|nr:hypothetical protein IRJ41_010371 [Triplophysa rosa]